MRNHLPGKAFLLFLMLFVAGVSFAGDANGMWRSSSGAIIKLWSNFERVDLKLTDVRGKTIKMYGYWVDPGSQFAYQYGRTTNYATFIDNYTLRVEGDDGGVSVWTRSPEPAQSGYYQPQHDPTSDVGAWNAAIERNRANQNPYNSTGYSAPPEPDPTSDIEAWNNAIKRNTANNSPGYVAPAQPDPTSDVEAWNNAIKKNTANTKKSQPKTKKKSKDLFKELGQELLNDLKDAIEEDDDSGDDWD